MEDTICLDTDFLINFLRNDKNTVSWVREHEGECNIATTILNIFELYYGAYKSLKPEESLKAVRKLIDRLAILEMSLYSVELAGKQKAQLEKEGKDLDFRDVLIGAIAITNNCALKTNNIKSTMRHCGLNLKDVSPRRHSRIEDS